MNAPATRSQLALALGDELVVDNFAGGGGASLGIEMALGRPVDIAINHDPTAIAMHAINHASTHHYCESVFKVDPDVITANRPVGLAWFSPDCTHHSKAKGGKPRSAKVRGLAWVVIRWARRVRPRVIMLENVEEFQDWGPLDEHGKPIKAKAGMTFRLWLNQLRAAGYAVESRELRACDYGVPTIRKRLFVIARRDGLPIVWPTPTHGPGLFALRTAAECIDWSVPCRSIFGRERPLAENTLRRIARGIMKYVVNSAEPFIVPLCHTADARVHALSEPLRTLTTAKGGEFALATPYLVGAGGPERAGKPAAVGAPLGTALTENHRQLVTAFLAKHYGGNYEGAGSAAAAPLHTVTTTDLNALVTAHLMTNTTGHSGANLGAQVPTVTTGQQQTVVTTHMLKFRGDNTGIRATDPLPTITAGPRENPAGAAHALGVAASSLVKLRNNCVGQDTREPLHTVTNGGHFGEVRALLMKFYGTSSAQGAAEPLHTVTTKDRFGLVTVRGEVYAIADIRMRMLQPRELYRAQGFPDRYVIEFEHKGRQLPKSAQIRMCGNSVCPPLAKALVEANFAHERAWKAVA